MSAFWLKLIALLTMLVDHIAAAMNRAGLMDPVNYSGALFSDGAFSLYWIMRAIGRIAFPIFCFQLVEGAIHTKNKGAYAVRLAVFAMLSEFPFDLGLHRSLADWSSQNVFLTLFIGLLLIYELQWADSQEGKNRVMGYIAYAVLSVGTSYLCSRLLFNDYGAAGIMMISVMGLLSLKSVQALELKISPRVIRLLFTMVGMLACIYLSNDFESWCLLALVPIGFYNGEKGYSNKAFQYGAYLFYPVHLLILGLLFAVPQMLH